MPIKLLKMLLFLSFLVPPSVVGENTLEDVKVKEKQSITLTCEVTGKGLSSRTVPPLNNYSFPLLRIRVEKTSSCCNMHLKLNFRPAYRNIGRSLLVST